jgi:hypothetical protein|tara:strand:- start:7430 stop:7729 length:300 start_codon:yes stop_codon:yes gene_type:complete
MQKFIAKVKSFFAEETASIGPAVASLILGVIFLVIGGSLMSTIISNYVTAGTTTGIGSFGGTQGTLDLVPLVAAAVILVAGASMIGAPVFNIVRKQVKN